MHRMGAGRGLGRLEGRPLAGRQVLRIDMLGQLFADHPRPDLLDLADRQRTQRERAVGHADQAGLGGAGPRPWPQLRQATLIYVHHDQAALVHALCRCSPHPIPGTVFQRSQPAACKQVQQQHRQARKCEPRPQHAMAAQLTTPEGDAAQHAVVAKGFLKRVASLATVRT